MKTHKELPALKRSPDPGLKRVLVRAILFVVKMEVSGRNDIAVYLNRGSVTLPLELLKSANSMPSLKIEVCLTALKRLQIFSR